MASIRMLKSLTSSVLCSRILSSGPLMIERTSSLVPCVQHFRWSPLPLDCASAGISSHRNSIQTLPVITQQISLLHTSANTSAWIDHNKTVYPPQKPGEPRRPAEIYFSRKDIKHSQRKMWYITTFIKGMMIDDALTQLQHVNKKAAKIAREVLLEAQEEAVKKHNVEFKSNLHIAEALAGKGKYQHAIRYHAKGRGSVLDLVYCHLHIKLQEGPPAEKPQFTGYDQAKHYLESKRKRTITHGL